MESKSLKILAVDDNQDNLLVLKAIVADAFPGARLLTARNGASGLALARAEEPDVLLLDIVMPGQDGFAVCRRLKEDEALRHIPVVFLTALRTDREIRIQALEAGAEGFLTKPIEEAELTAQIRAMAKIKAASDRERRETDRLATLVAERTRELGQELTERKRAEAALRESLAEKDCLLKEVHHRVKNNLQVVVSLLHLQANRVQNPAVLDVLRETQCRVRAMALLHETLYRSASLARIPFASYLNALCKQIFRAYGPETARLTLRLGVADVPLGLDQAVPCGLIINELVSNALKYAFPEGRTGEIAVELEVQDVARAPASSPSVHPGPLLGEPLSAPPPPAGLHAAEVMAQPAEQNLVLRVTDTGVGLPSDFDHRHTRSLGLQLVFNLARQLRGTARWEPGPGTRLAIIFPRLQDSSFQA